MLPVIDTHVHFWDLSRFRYPWLEADDCVKLRTDYLPAHFEADMDGLDVQALVHVQADVDHAIDPVEETAWLASLMASSSRNSNVPEMVCVGYADLRTRDLDDVLSRHAEHHCFRGIRQEAWFGPGSAPADGAASLLTDPCWIVGLRTLAGHAMSFDLLVDGAQLDQACAIFRELPELSVVVDHMGVPALLDGAPRPAWRNGLRRFADQVPQSVLKISGMGFIHPSWTMVDIEHVVRESIEMFGPDRCMFGSNYPVERPSASYGHVWQAYDAATCDLSAAERSDLFSGTARRVYRIPQAPAPQRGDRRQC